MHASLSLVRKTLAIAALACVAQAAHAIPYTANANESILGTDLAFNGTATLSFSNDVLIAFSLGQVTNSAVSPATYVEPTVTVGISTLTLESSNGEVLGLTTTGGARQVALAGLTGTGGFAEITNIKVDVVGKVLFADVIGANGLVPQSQIPLFNIGTITGTTAWNTLPGTFVAGAEGLTLTTQGAAALTQALGLNAFGSNVLRNIGNFGSSVVTVNVGPIPEPSTYALIALGLGAAGVAARRRRVAVAA